MLTRRFPLTLGVGSIGQKPTFSAGHVEYQIKVNDRCSNLQANILSLQSEISLISCFGISEQ